MPGTVHATFRNVGCARRMSPRAREPARRVDVRQNWDTGWLRLGSDLKAAQRDARRMRLADGLGWSPPAVAPPSSVREDVPAVLDEERVVVALVRVFLVVRRLRLPVGDGLLGVDRPDRADIGLVAGRA
jgi:hypothetical protein